MTNYMMEGKLSGVRELWLCHAASFRNSRPLANEFIGPRSLQTATFDMQPMPVGYGQLCYQLKDM
jgi:hypothetical protein